MSDTSWTCDLSQLIGECNDLCIHLKKKLAPVCMEIDEHKIFYSQAIGSLDVPCC